MSGFFPLECVSIYNIAEITTNINNGSDAIKKGSTVISLYAYEKSKHDELEFEVGCKIVVLECPEGGWWRGSLYGEEGWFPANFVKVVDQNEEGFVEPAHTDLKSAKGNSFNDSPVTDDASLTSGARKFHCEQHSLVFVQADVYPKAGRVSDGSHYELEDTLILESVNHISAKMGKLSTESRVSLMSVTGLSKDEIMRGTSGLSEKDRKRMTVIWELIETEREYVKDLTIVSELFLKPMSSLASIGQRHSQLIFSNIDQILGVNFDFLRQLLQVDLKPENVGVFVEIFLSMVMQSNYLD